MNVVIETTSPPVNEPITLADAREHLRQDLTADDGVIQAAIFAARAYAENFLRRRLITQTVTITAHGWGGWGFSLEVAPIQSITSITYTATDGTPTVWAAQDYRLVSKSGSVPFIAPAYGTTWPTIRADFESVSVVAVVGYGPAASDIPPDIAAAVRLLVGHFYENRADEIAGTIVSKLTLSADRLLLPHKIYV